MLRSLVFLVPFLVATASLAQATITDPVQDDPGTHGLASGDAGDDWSTPTPLKVNGQTFEEFGILVPVDDPADFYLVQLEAEGIPGFFAVTVSPIGLDIQLAVMDARGQLHVAEPRGLGEPETVEIDYAMPGPYIVSVVDVTCQDVGLPCGEVGAFLPLSTVAGNYQLAMTCIPYC